MARSVAALARLPQLVGTDFFELVQTRTCTATWAVVCVCLKSDGWFRRAARCFSALTAGRNAGTAPLYSALAFPQAAFACVFLLVGVVHRLGAPTC